MRTLASFARRREVLALIAGAMVAVVLALAMHGSSDGDGGHRRSTTPVQPSARSATHVITVAAPVAGRPSRGAVVAAATADLIALSAATVHGGAAVRRALAGDMAGPLRAELEGVMPAVADRVRARLEASPSPSLFAGWPLGYRVESFAPNAATVAIWHLDVGASAALHTMSALYTTTTYTLRRLDGAWRIVAAANVPGPTPPPATAPAAEVNEFVTEVAGLTRYSYAP